MSSNVVLAVMARAPAEVVRQVIDRCSRFARRAVVVVAPNDPIRITDLRDLPAETSLMTEEWQGHAKTRTATLRHAEEIAGPLGWVLMADANEHASFTPTSCLPNLGATKVDAFDITIEAAWPGGRWRWLRGGHLMRAWRGFSWDGTGDTELHEVFQAPPNTTVERWPHLVYRIDQGAARPHAGGRTFERDVVALSEAHAKDPGDARTVFYLAQSLKDCGRHLEAIDFYLKRAGMGGFAEEVFWSHLWAAKLSALAGCPRREVTRLFAEAGLADSTRAEPAAEYAAVLRSWGEADLATHFAVEASRKDYPVDARLFVDVTSYSRRALEAAGVDP